jgi:hypothetical protein
MHHFRKLAVDFYLVTRGDETSLDDSAEDEVTKLVAKVKLLIGHSTCTFYATNTQALLEHVRKRKQTTKTIKWTNPPVQTPDGYIGLVRLEDYFEFLKDDDGELNETIFESNVRGYQGLTSVNNAMAATLSSGGPLNFWLLNNGITIISSGRVQPVTASEINVEDPQIVNGLQTSRKIFDYMASGRIRDDERAVLVKVLPVSNADHRRSIIRATNNQNPMNSATLLATDDVHYEIEDLFTRNNLFYDRRPGFYRDQGSPAASIVSVTELVQAVAALIEARPDTARARPSDYINRSNEYQRIFGRNNYKYYIAYVLSARLTGKLYFTPEALLQIDNGEITDEAIENAFMAVNQRYGEMLLGETADGVTKGTKLLASLKADLTEQGLDGSAAARRLTRKLKPRYVIKELERL